MVSGGVSSSDTYRVISLSGQVTEVWLDML